VSVLLLGAHMSVAGGVSQALDRAASVGSNAVQVFTKNNRQWKGPPINADDVARWNAEKPARHIEASVSHASYLINMASPKDDLWEKSLLAYQDELERAHAYGIPHVVVHPGAHTGSGPEAGIARIAAALNRVHEATPDYTDTMTLLELTAGQGTTLGRNFNELHQIIAQVEDPSRVGICVDTCHAFAAGYEFASPAGFERTMATFEAEVGCRHLVAMHINDSKGGLGSRVDRHQHLGRGEIGLRGFRNVVNDSRLVGLPMVIETPKPAAHADAINLAILRALHGRKRVGKLACRLAEQAFDVAPLL
jgi:deoxyribonuclease-4